VCVRFAAVFGGKGECGCVVWVGAHEHVVCRISVVSAIDELEWCTTKLLSTNIHTLYQVQLNANKLKIILKIWIHREFTLYTLHVYF
jgi:hypothetical protein